MHSDNAFVTLTYNDANLPSDKGLHHEHFQKFFKRLRKKYSHLKLRFYMCGEYGDLNARPHFHACIFGLSFDDRVLWSKSGGNRLYTSPTLDQLWPYGFASIGDVTFESAAYTARYILKKITGQPAFDHYNSIDPDTGEITTRKPEYNKMSLKPGIGKPWLDKFQTDVYPHDYVIINSKKVKPPKYYDKLFKRTDLASGLAFDTIEFDRFRLALKHVADNTPDRLAVKHTVTQARSNLSQRNKV
jgi:hypothetical protein